MPGLISIFDGSIFASEALVREYFISIFSVFKLEDHAKTGYLLSFLSNLTC